MKSAELTIEGMSCGHCVMSVQKALAKLRTLEIEDVQIGKARVTFDETEVSIVDLDRAIEEAGYKLIR